MIGKPCHDRLKALRNLDMMRLQKWVGKEGKEVCRLVGIPNGLSITLLQKIKIFLDNIATSFCFLKFPVTFFPQRSSECKNVKIPIYLKFSIHIVCFYILFFHLYSITKWILNIVEDHNGPTIIFWNIYIFFRSQ